MAELSVMVFCGRSPRHLYVANRLCQAAHPLAIVQEAGAEWNAKKIQRLLRPANVWRKGWRWLRDRKRYQGGKEAQFFFGSDSPHLIREDLQVEVAHINHPEVLALTKRLKPDVITVFGTSLIRGELLEQGRLGIINLHGGLSPHYRGADCTFWALYNGEPDQVGCTLHYIDAGVDTGNLIAHICPEIKEGDDELTLFWRAVKDSAEVFAEALERLGQGEQLGQRQRQKGRLYQVKDRLWRHERELEKRLAGGVLKDINLQPRVLWFPSE
ncbi:formyl transferase [Nitrosococcus wardiae]|uniref:phosphoribosylglycinamide formyltransferase 1 n=1 Tax=Nitrosococcus wardiae TaxID=1814290 RepID=A0A4P7BWM1_9GAMM|nr:formyl transferase [Nitrosococcus wardiae]QBQ54488.1 formyl transferase [Nitrosococcus wardiae]